MIVVSMFGLRKERLLRSELRAQLFNSESDDCGIKFNKLSLRIDRFLGCRIAIVTRNQVGMWMRNGVT